MTSSTPATFTNWFSKGFLLVVLSGLALVFLGRFLAPAASLLSLAGAGLVLVLYGLAGWFGFRRLHPEILTLAGFFGLLAGAIFAAEICLEYVLLPQDNTRWGLIEFGGVFAVYFFSSLIAAQKNKSLRAGLLTAVVSAMLSSAIWLSFLLLTFYLFQGSARQAAVFRAEGTEADFARSGMSDFTTFVMEDLYGAGFFHLLLAPCFAVILGMLGGLAGKGLAHFKTKG
jgi:hypothetical protein